MRGIAPMKSYEKVDIEVLNVTCDVITDSVPINIGYDTPIVDCLDYPGLGG
jgi:hypothetical protein